MFLTALPESPAGGFDVYISNASEDSTLGVYGFAGLEIVDGMEPNGSNSGHAESLLEDVSSSFWNLQADLTPPTHDEVVHLTSLPNLNLDPGTVYTVDVNEVNSITNSSSSLYTYNLTDDGVAIVYVTGSSPPVSYTHLTLPTN